MADSPQWVWPWEDGGEPEVLDIETEGAAGGGVIRVSYRPPSLPALVAARVAKLMADGVGRTAEQIVAETRPIGGFPCVDTGLRFSLLVEGELLHSGRYVLCRVRGEDDPVFRLAEPGRVRTRWERIVGGEL